MAVLSHVYLDESGTHDDSPNMTMAGYLFRADQAQRFTRDWAKDLKRIGLPCAHMTDCANGYGDYRDMELEERIQSEKLLIQHIKRRSLFGFGVSLDPHYYAKAVDDIKGAPSAYTFCVLSCITMVRRWIERTNYDGKIAYFFEAGHRHANEADQFMNDIPANGPERMKKFAYLSHTFIDKREALPLQAADMLAWQSCHFKNRFDQGFTKARADFLALVRPQDITNDYTHDHIDAWRVSLKRLGPTLSRMPAHEVEPLI